MLTETFFNDLRIGFRLLIKHKSFCALAVVVLALGICGVTTMFSVVDGVMLRGFSFPNASRMMNVNFIDPSTVSILGANGQISSPDFEEMLPQQESFQLMASYIVGSTVHITNRGQPKRYEGVYLTEDFMRILGVAPVLGRDLRAEDNQEGAEKVAIISHATWQRDFGASPDIVGTPVRINGDPGTIIGVMPQGFSFPQNEEIWLPLYSEFPVRPRNDPRARVIRVLGLIKPDVTLEQAKAEISAFARRFAEAYPDTNKEIHAGLVEPLLNMFVPQVLRGTLLTMLGFCVGVLLIACVNVMTMHFAQASLRSHELVVRASLGATRTRLLRQMLTESLLVASLGAAAGIGLAYFCTNWLSATYRSLDNPPPSWVTIELEPRALAVTVGATLFAALVSGLAPAWMSARTDLVNVMKDGARTSTNRGVSLFSRGLLVFQIVATCILLLGSTLQMRSILNQQTIDYGYDTGSILSARMALMDGEFPTQEARKRFYDRLLPELLKVPEFEAVSFTNRVRMVLSGSVPVEIEGREYSEKRDRTYANFEQVTGGFFDVTSQKLLQGRTFGDEDLDSKMPVAIVNSVFANKHFGTESPIGLRFRTVDAKTTQPGPWRTIVGVVTSIRMLGPFDTPNVDESGFYIPFYSAVTGPVLPEPLVSQFATVIVKPRIGRPAESLADTLRRQVSRFNPDMPLYWVGTPKDNMLVYIGPARILAVMFSSFGLVAFIIASVGIYALMSHWVNQRTREFGVRMALGARRGRLMAMVLRQGSVWIGLGLALGLALALAIVAAGGNGIQSILVGVSVRDPFTYGVVVGLIMVVSLIAILMPASRATRLDRMAALRAE